MVIVMQRGASENQIQLVIDRLISEGFDVHRSTGVERTVLGVVGGKVVYAAEPFAALGEGLTPPPLPPVSPAWSPVAHFGAP